MRPIQFLLIGLIAAGAWVYFARLRSRLIDRLIVLSLASAGAALVLMPHWSIRVAVLVGVGRGVDLVIYLLLTLLLFVCLLLYSQVRTLQARLADLTRAIAIKDARPADPSAVVTRERRMSNAA